MAVSAPTLDRLRADGEALMQEISREYYLAHAGHKPTAELQPIYERHAGVLSPDSLAAVIEAFRGAAAGSDEQRSARLLAEWQIEAQVSRLLAPLDEREIAWESSAIVRLRDGRSMPYQRVAIEIANATDRAERLALDDARASLVELELASLKREKLQREKDYVESLQLAPDYIATFETLSGIDLRALAGACAAFLRDTQAMWDEVHPEFVRRGLGIEPREATRADALALLRAREFDRYFPAERMEPAVRRQHREIGIDPEASGRIRLDIGEREGKRSRAFCAPVKVPHEVYLVLRPHGGQTDYTTFLHELGHALHFAYMRPDLPFEYRWLGDNSITESFAMLLDHRMQDRGWLLRYTELERQSIDGFLRAAAFEELQFLRRYCAKLLYEVGVYGGEHAWDSLPDVYVETLTSATHFRYRRADAFVDLDPRFYAARYLRAWQLQAQLADTLVHRFDEDWWRNPRAGPWMVQALFSEGQRELASELAQRVSGRELSFDPLVRAIERNLGA